MKRVLFEFRRYISELANSAKSSSPLRLHNIIQRSPCFFNNSEPRIPEEKGSFKVMILAFCCEELCRSWPYVSLVCEALRKILSILRESHSPRVLK
jgi:hypothetical protein